MFRKTTLRRRRPLTVEGLEDRSLMAVFSSVGGVLTITGTGQDDVLVRQQQNGQLQVSVNGGCTYQNAGVVNTIIANLGSCDDTITIGELGNPVALLGNVVLNLGDGSDTANIRVSTPGSVIVDGGYQVFDCKCEDDIVDIDQSIIGSLVVNTYGGDDDLDLEGSIIFSLTANLGVPQLSPFTWTGCQTDNDIFDVDASVLGTATVSLGTATTYGNNLVTMSSTLFSGFSVVGGDRQDKVIIDSAGTGIGDTIDDLIVHLVDDLEPLIQRFLPATQMLSNLDLLFGQLDGMLGDSSFSLGHVLDGLQNLDPRYVDLSDTVACLLQGHDLTFIGNKTIGGNLTITTLDGKDCVELIDSKFLGSAVVSLGGGNDFASIQNVSAAYLLLDGGLGYDVAQVNGFFGPGPIVVINFEVQI